MPDTGAPSAARNDPRCPDCGGPLLQREGAPFLVCPKDQPCGRVANPPYGAGRVTDEELTAIEEHLSIPWQNAHVESETKSQWGFDLRWLVERVRAFGPMYHVIDLRADGWTIQHPISCRPDLFNCQVNRVAEKQLQTHPGRKAYGQYRVDLIGDDKPVLRIAQKREAARS